jgi:hypothetical protein
MITIPLDPAAQQRIGFDEASKRFMKDLRNTVTCLQGGEQELGNRVAAEIQLHEAELRIGVNIALYKLVSAHANGVEGAALRPFNQDVVEAQYESLARAFVNVLQRDAFVFPDGVSDEANAEIRHMLQVVGALPKDPPALSPEESLRNQVLEDFNGVYEDVPAEPGRKAYKKQVKPPLRAADFRAKCNANRAYRECYERLAETSAITAAITVVHDGHGEQP